MSTNATKFPDDMAKIACTLSYMTKGTANTWAQAFFEEKALTGTLVPGTWTDFQSRLNSTFKDVNLQVKAVKSLLGDKFDIDKEGSKGFFANYEILVREANIVTGTTTHNAVHVSNLNRLLPFDLRDKINAVDPVPVTYDRFE